MARTTIFRRLIQPLEARPIPTVSRTEKYRSLVALVLIALGFLVVDLYLVFDTNRIRKKAEGELQNFFQASVKVSGLKFQILSHLYLEKVLVDKANLFQMELQGVQIDHHPLLSLVGFYSPVYTNIERMKIRIHHPRAEPRQWMDALDTLLPPLQKIKRIQVQHLEADMGSSLAFPTPHKYILENATLQYRKDRGIVLQASHYNLNQYTMSREQPSSAPLPWDTLELFINYRPKKKEIFLRLEIDNFHLKPDSYKYLPQYLQKLVHNWEGEGIMSLLLQYHYVDKGPSKMTFTLRGFNLKFQWKGRELTKGELYLNFNQKRVAIRNLQGLVQKKDVQVQNISIPLRSSPPVQWKLKVIWDNRSKEYSLQSASWWEGLVEQLPEKILQLQP